MSDSEILAGMGDIEQPIGPKKVKGYNLPEQLIEQIKNAASAERVSESEMARVTMANGLRMYQASKKKSPKAAKPVAQMPLEEVVAG